MFKKLKRRNKILLVFGIIGLVAISIVVYLFSPTPRIVTSTDIKTINSFINLKYSPIRATGSSFRVRGSGTHFPPDQDPLYDYIAYVQLGPLDIQAIESIIESQKPAPKQMLVSGDLYLTWFPQSLQGVLEKKSNYFTPKVPAYDLKLISNTKLFNGAFIIAPEDYIFIHFYPVERGE